MSESAEDLKFGDDGILRYSDGRDLIVMASEDCDELIGAAKNILAKLDYLRSLWGDEGVTRSLCDSLRNAVEKVEAGFQ